MLWVLLAYAVLQADILEDMIFGDIGRSSGGLLANIDFLFAPVVSIAAMFAITHIWMGHEIHGGWRHHDLSVQESFAQTGQLPLLFPILLFEDHNGSPKADLVEPLVLAGNAIWAFGTLYFMLKWKSSIVKNK